MTQLKTNFAIRTTNENFRAHVEALKVLGYKIYPPTDAGSSMDGGYCLAVRYTMGNDVYRSSGFTAKDQCFNNIQDFLVWHSTPEPTKKTEAEILLDSLEEEMQQLQTKIATVRKQMLKEIKEK